MASTSPFSAKAENSSAACRGLSAATSCCAADSTGSRTTARRLAPIARDILLGKLANTKAVLRRFMREHPPEGEAGEKFRSAVSTVEALTAQIKVSSDTDEMRGFEGTAARAYFDAFDGMILHQKDYFKFTGRSKRPPLDAVNAMLSFVYGLLANETEAALEGVGLDPAVGFLHKDRPGRPSLALDLMEEFRPWLADRLVLSMINMKQVKPENFRISESGAVTMDDGARKKILAEWRARKEDEITHPYTRDKMPLGMVPHIQALLLARRNTRRHGGISALRSGNRRNAKCSL